MAGIADVYDAMVSDRPHMPAITSYQALAELNRLKGATFHPAVVEAFTQAIGIFPTGTIVELESGEVAIVVAQNPLRRLQPEVIVVLDRSQAPCKRYITRNLCREVEQLTDEYRIARELPTGAHGLDPSAYFL